MQSSQRRKGHSPLEKWSTEWERERGSEGEKEWGRGRQRGECVKWGGGKRRGKEAVTEWGGRRERESGGVRGPSGAFSATVKMFGFINLLGGHGR